MNFIIISVIISAFVYFSIYFIRKSLFPCDDCPLKEYCKKLDEEGEPNVCGKTLNSYFDKNS